MIAGFLTIVGLGLDIWGVVMLWEKEKPKLIDGGSDSTGLKNQSGEIRYNKTALSFIVIGFVLQIVGQLTQMVKIL